MVQRTLTEKPGYVSQTEIADQVRPEEKKGFEIACEQVEDPYQKMSKYKAQASLGSPPNEKSLTDLLVAVSKGSSGKYKKEKLTGAITRCTVNLCATVNVFFRIENVKNKIMLSTNRL